MRNTAAMNAGCTYLMAAKVLPAGIMDSPETHLLTRVGLRKALGIADSTISVYLTQGLPHTIVDGKKAYDLEQVKQWCQENNVKAGADATVKERYWKAKAKKEQELAELAQLKKEREQGKVVSVAKVEKQNVQKFTTIRNKFSSLPVRVAPKCEGHSIAEIEAIIEEEVTEILKSLGDMGG